MEPIDKRCTCTEYQIRGSVFVNNKVKESSESYLCRALCAVLNLEMYFGKFEAKELLLKNADQPVAG